MKELLQGPLGNISIPAHLKHGSRLYIYPPDHPNCQQTYLPNELLGMFGN